MASAQTTAVPAASGALLRLAAVVSVFAVWLLSRPYGGVVHDACLYIGRALADLDPQGVGQDLAFRRDQQSGFSLFTPLVLAAVKLLGPGGAGMVLSAAGLAAWLAGAALLVSRFAKGRLFWAALTCLAAMPKAYGGHGVFQWAEPFVTPRIFAEAAALAGLAWLVEGRRIAAAAALALSTALHPLMAAGALGCAFLWLAAKDRRWWILAGLAAAGLIAAGLAGAPMAERLFQQMDPAWREVLRVRTPYLFPRLWGGEAWALFVCQLAVLGLAWRAVEPRLQPLVAGAVVVALAGVVAALTIPTVLAMQLQPWRAQWIAGVLAAALLPLVAAKLWRDGPAGRAALALLTLGLLAHDVLLLAVAGAGGAVWLSRLGRTRQIPAKLAALAWLLTGLFAAVLSFERGWAIVEGYRAMSPGGEFALSMMLETGLQRLVAVAAIAIALSDLRLEAPRALALAGLASAGLALAAVAFWDDRSAFIRDRDTGVGAASLRSHLGPGSVYWMDSAGLTPLWTGRAQWWSGLQGSGSVFDRELALTWNARILALIEAGAALPQDRAPLDRAQPRTPLTLTAGALTRACAIPDGPDWIVVPTNRLAPGAAKGAALWTAPSPEFRIDPADGSWRANRVFAVIGCGARPR